MKKDYSKTRLLALLSAFIFVFSLVLSGCSIGNKLEKPNIKAGKNDIIDIVTDNQDGMSEYSQIVIGADGQSYLVDGEGNSVLYNPVSTYTVTDPSSSSSSSSSTTSSKVQNPVTLPTIAPLPTSSSSKTEVYNALAIQRKFGFNKAYDNFAGLANFYLDTIRVYFTYDEKDWLIELWKGEYAMASVGCEIGFYYNDKPSSSSNGPLAASVGEKKHFKAVEDKDAMYCSMELWQYVKSTDAEPVKRIDFGRRRCWWAASFENGVLEKHSDRTSLVMRGTIEFPTYEMMELFVEGLEERGFVEGSTSTYKNVERFTVSGKKVTVNWRYYDEDRFWEAD